MSSHRDADPRWGAGRFGVWLAVEQKCSRSVYRKVGRRRQEPRRGVLLVDGVAIPSSGRPAARVEARTVARFDQLASGDVTGGCARSPRTALGRDRTQSVARASRLRRAVRATLLRSSRTTMIRACRISPRAPVRDGPDGYALAFERLVDLPVHDSEIKTWSSMWKPGSMSSALSAACDGVAAGCAAPSISVRLGGGPCVPRTRARREVVSVGQADAGRRDRCLGRRARHPLVADRASLRRRRARAPGSLFGHASRRR